MKFSVTTWINDELVTFQEPLADPFVNHRLFISWRDRFKSLFKKDFIVSVVINGDRETVFKVMNLDRVRAEDIADASSETGSEPR